MNTIASPKKEPPLLKEEVSTKFLITLEVEAAELFNLDYPPSKKAIYNYCFISDSDTKEFINGADIERFESLVKKGQLIEWEGNSRNDPKREYTVAIESIVYAFYKENELDSTWKENFFDAIAICGKKNQRTVSEEVKEDFQRLPAVHIYNINFSITWGDIVKRFSIDPRLKIER